MTIQQAPQHAPDIIYRRMDNISPEPIQWLWKEFIALGKISLIAGYPGLGKSQLTTMLSAIVSNGNNWPITGDQCQQGNVILLSAEDDPEDTIRPRLEAAGANLSKVFVLDSITRGYRSNGSPISEGFDLTKDIVRLENMLIQIGSASLIIIDPITAYLGDADSNNISAIRGRLLELSQLATKHHVSILCVTHLNKNSSGDIINRVVGSGAFVAAARAVFAVVRDSENEERRLFLPIKNNLGRDKGGISFTVESVTLESGIETSRIVWGDEELERTADDIMQQESGSEDRSALQEAISFLDEIFDSEEIILANNLKKQAREVSISERTLQRALKKVGARCKKENKRAGKWYWYIQPPREIGKVGDVKTFNNQYLNELSNTGGMIKCSACKWWNTQRNKCLNTHPKAKSSDPERLRRCICFSR